MTLRKKKQLLHLNLILQISPKTKSSLLRKQGLRPHQYPRPLPERAKRKKPKRDLARAGLSLPAVQEHERSPSLSVCLGAGIRAGTVERVSNLLRKLSLKV